MEHEESIDLGRLMHIMMERKKITGGLVAGCTVLALGVSFILPKQYESTALVQTRSAGKDISGAAAMAAAMGVNLGGSSSNASPLNYIELMKSRRVLDPIIDQIDWPDEKKKPDAKEFAKKNLKIENTKQTNLITVTATGRTPEEAQSISQGVVDNFLTMQTENSRQTQSLLIQFLNENIDAAKTEAEEASQKFAEYQKEHKVYSPDEQAKATVAKMNAFDEAIGNMEVQMRANHAKLDSVTAKLGDMQASSLNFNINDNSNVQSLRNQIVSKQVSLVALTQKYTESHPAVIAARKELSKLQQSLTEEVNAVVGSRYTSLSPAQAALVQEEANAQASIAVAEASKAAIEQRRAEKEKELGDFPQAVLEYMRLQRDANIKNEIYVNLVKQCENDKIQEAMESMDIQIIDAANLPNQPSAPRKKRIAAIGFLIGCLLSFCYGLVFYKRHD